MLTLPKLGVLAVALALGTSVPAYAAGQTPDQMKQRIEQLESQVQKLQELVEKAMAKADQAANATAATADQTAEVNRLSVKVDAMDDAAEASGFKDLKITGMIDPTYIYNKAQDSSGFNFLSNFDGRDGNEIYAYDNSFFGQAMVELDKTFENGTLLKLILAPHKSTASGYNLLFDFTLPSFYTGAGAELKRGDWESRHWWPT